MNRGFVGLAMLVVAMGCGDRPVFGPGPDARGVDAALDAQLEDVGPTHDGGADASDGRIDADRPDVGAIDAGVDAGTDAGLDADLPDVDVPDADLPDVGIDAALADVGTDAGPHLGPIPVDLGTDGDLATPAGYAVLAEAGLTNVIGSMITGEVGVSPAAATSITGLALSLDASGRFATSPAVVAPGRVYAASYTPPTPATLGAAVLAMQAAYDDAASRTGADATNLLLGHIGGAALAPGLYHWASSVDVALPITIVGGPDDVWIFQVDDGLDVGAGVTMTLVGGARAQNVFWQVAGQITTGPASHAEGILLGHTGITMQTGASLHGRALAQTLVALDDDVITTP